jgi:acetyl esterase/lipase
VLAFDQIQDVKKAMRWVGREVGRYGGDRNKVFLGGVSAGAHLCAALLAEEEGEEGREGGQVRGLLLSPCG